MIGEPAALRLLGATGRIDDLVEAAPEHALAVERHVALRPASSRPAMIFSQASSRAALSGHSMKEKTTVSPSSAFTAR